MTNFSVKYAKKVVENGFQPSYMTVNSKKNPPMCRELTVQNPPILCPEHTRTKIYGSTLPGF